MLTQQVPPAGEPTRMTRPVAAPAVNRVLPVPEAAGTVRCVHCGNAPGEGGHHDLSRRYVRIRWRAPAVGRQDLRPWAAGLPRARLVCRVLACGRAARRLRYQWRSAPARRGGRPATRWISAGRLSSRAAWASGCPAGSLPGPWPGPASSGSSPVSRLTRHSLGACSSATLTGTCAAPWRSSPGVPRRSGSGPVFRRGRPRSGAPVPPGPPPGPASQPGAHRADRGSQFRGSVPGQGRARRDGGHQLPGENPDGHARRDLRGDARRRRLHPHGRRHPGRIPALLNTLAVHAPARLPVTVDGGTGDQHCASLDPASLADSPPPVTRPRFLAIISSAVLAGYLCRSDATRPDGFVLETPVAGGHSAPPRGRLRLGRPANRSTGRATPST